MQLSLPLERHDLAQFFANLRHARDKQSLTHGLHPYPAKFIPHIPRRLIEEYSSVGDLVLDPMCGSGTTMVEAAALNRRSIGTDLNPVAVLVSRAKTTPLDADSHRALRRLAEQLRFSAREIEAGRASQAARAGIPVFPNRDHWFEPQVASELALALRHIDELECAAATYALCAFSAVVVAVSNQESETRWAAIPKHVPVGQTLDRIAARLETSFGASAKFSALSPSESAVARADARALPLRTGSVDLVVTSPPYANSHDYYLYNKLRLFWLGHQVGPVQSAEIGSRNKHSDLKQGIEPYTTAMGAVLAEMRRVLKDGRLAVVVVADAVIRGEFHDARHLFRLEAERHALRLREAFDFAHKVFTSSFHRAFGTPQPKKTHVLVFEAS
jgi:DNA modification methylase